MNVINPVDVERYRTLRDQITILTAQLDEIKDRWRSLGPGKFGPVTITQPARFDEKAAHDWLVEHDPKLLQAASRSVLDAKLVKQLVSPAIYNGYMTTPGTPSIRVGK